MNTHAHSAEPQHAYRLSAPTLTIYLLGLLVLVLGVVGTMRIMLSVINIGGIILVSVLAGACLYTIPLYVYLFLQRLVISAWGVTVYGGGFRIDAQIFFRENIVGLASHQGRWWLPPERT